jgi:hypothetical protein
VFENDRFFLFGCDGDPEYGLVEGTNKATEGVDIPRSTSTAEDRHGGVTGNLRRRFKKKYHYSLRPWFFFHNA